MQQTPIPPENWNQGYKPKPSFTKKVKNAVKGFFDRKKPIPSANTRTFFEKYIRWNDPPLSSKANKTPMRLTIKTIAPNGTTTEKIIPVNSQNPNFLNYKKQKKAKQLGGTRKKRPTPYNLRAANELFRRSPQVAANNIKLLTKSRNKRMLRQLRKLSNTTRRR